VSQLQGDLTIYKLDGTLGPVELFESFERHCRRQWIQKNVIKPVIRSSVS
jgi:hypothetical protein